MNSADAPKPRGGAQQEDPDYTVFSRREILTILHSLEAERKVATIYFGERDFIVSMVLAVNPEFEEIVLDFGADQRANARLLVAPRVLVVSNLAQIRIEFSAGTPNATVHENLPAFRIRMPEVLTRLQRRQYYRVRVPARQELRCRIPAPGGGDASFLVRVVNLSCGGAALTNLPLDLDLEPGTRLFPCLLTLGDGEPLAATAEVVRVIDMPPSQRPAERICGVQFVELSDGARARIQRFINRVEREEIARSRALG
ncbi:MAG: flagellar brake protein [Casimicrobiaceae bacterium]